MFFIIEKYLTKIFLLTLCFYGLCLCIYSKDGVKNSGLSKIQSENIAKSLLLISAKKLEQNRADPVGISLIKFAQFFDSQASNLFLLLGIIESGKEIPKELIYQNLNEKILIQNLIKISNIRDIDYLNLIIWKLILTLSPENQNAAIALQSVKRIGISIELEQLLQNSDKGLPYDITQPQIPPELPLQTRSKIVSLSSRYARLLFHKNPTNPTTPKLINFGRVIDFNNRELILLETQVEDGFPIVHHDIIFKEILLSYLKIATKREKNSELINFVLHSTILLLDPNDLQSIASVQKAKRIHFLRSFNSIISKYRNERTKYSQSKNEDSEKKKNPKISKVINLQLADFLINKKWILESVHTREEWFFSFRKTRLTPEIGGFCEGKIGNRIHTWKKWTMMDSVLIIDGYARYKFSPAKKIWVQQDGGDSTVLK